MAQKNELIEQMLEHLVNDDQTKAEELFHEYVVAKSREIYEGLIESEMPKDEDEEDDEDDEERKDEGFDDEVAVEAPEMDDETDDLEMELDADSEDEDDDMEEKSEEELFQDLDAIVDELQAKFDELKGDDMDDMGGDMGSDEEMKDEFELETVREYVEKVPAGHGAEKKGQAEKADGSASGMKFSKNDMGGTSANILSGRNGSEGSTSGALKGNGLLKGNPQDMKTGNINVPGGKAGGAFSNKEPGHGAEKKGAAEGRTDGQSLFRGRR